MKETNYISCKEPLRISPKTLNWVKGTNNVKTLFTYGDAFSSMVSTSKFILHKI